ncbi:hypothetical protein TRICI_006763 [Trichomonascus ciferrii]|uniref:Uncharacterized protein n=1 Tax=Trichomonascus ciferrii TaxID=44093 RepID=A0A642UDN0_9ASCO|nr:hypothetical protein TRICI_006763 [Trichomonascus ciferrii]
MRGHKLQQEWQKQHIEVSRFCVARVQHLQGHREFEYIMDNNKYSNFIILQGRQGRAVLKVSIRESILSTSSTTLLASSSTTAAMTTVESTSSIKSTY